MSTPLEQVANPGTITYTTDAGTVMFDSLTKTRIEARPTPDDADRTNKYVTYAITVHGFIHAANVSAENTAMDTLQDILLTRGGQLVLTNIGFDAGIDTALAGVTPDMIWGAKPMVISWHTFGFVCAEVVWTCEFHVNRCATESQLAALPFSMFNYEISYRNNSEGLTTRVISGAAECPALRNGNLVTFNIERLWDKIICAVPEGFRRTNVQRDISNARNRLEFAFVDEQLTGDPLPAGIVDGRMTYSFQNQPPGFMNWLGSLVGTLTVAPGQHPSLAGRVFFQIFFAKMAAALQAAGKVKDGMVLPVQLRVAHDLWTRTSSFGGQFKVIACLHDMLQAAGIWTPVPGTNYAQWATSMAGVWGNRGTAGLKFNAADDRLIDACVSYDAAHIGNDTSSKTVQLGNFTTQLTCPAVTPARSYLVFDNRLEFHNSHAAVLHRLAQSFNPANPTSYQEHITQFQGAPDSFILMIGKAARIKFKPDLPELTSFGGAGVELLAENNRLDQTPAMSFFDCPVFKGQWSRLYRVQRGPTSTVAQIKGPKSPQECA